MCAIGPVTMVTPRAGAALMAAASALVMLPAAVATARAAATAVAAATAAAAPSSAAATVASAEDREPNNIVLEAAENGFSAASASRVDGSSSLDRGSIRAV